MTRQARCSLGLLFGVLAACLAACDETAQPRPAEPEGAVSRGGAGAGGHAGVGAGTGGSAGCSAAAPPLSPAVLPAATLGEPYAQELSIVGATAVQVGWMTRGPLPDGLLLAEDERELSGPPPEAHARLSGTPSATGTFRFTVAAALLVQPPCAAPAAQRDYELVVIDDADAGAP